MIFVGTALIIEWVLRMAVPWCGYQIQMVNHRAKSLLRNRYHFLLLSATTLEAATCIMRRTFTFQLPNLSKIAQWVMSQMRRPSLLLIRSQIDNIRQVVLLVSLVIHHSATVGTLLLNNETCTSQDGSSHCLLTLSFFNFFVLFSPFSFHHSTSNMQSHFIILYIL